MRWKSTAPKVAGVDSSGQITAFGEGDAEIVLASEGLSRRMRVTVVPPRVAFVELSSTSIELVEEESVQVEVSLMDKSGRPIQGRTVGWSSDHPSVAEVSAEGWITAAAVGEAVITAECEGQPASVQVRVTPDPVAEIELSQDEAWSAAGRQRRALGELRIGGRGGGFHRTDHSAGRG